MTIDQLNKLTDEEVRVRVAERMGWKRQAAKTINYLHYPAFACQGEATWIDPQGSDSLQDWIPNYPSDLNAAFTLVEKLRGEGWMFVSVGPKNHSNWYVDFAQHGTIHQTEHPSLARAISLAFLAAQGSKDELDTTKREQGVRRS